MANFVKRKIKNFIIKNTNLTEKPAIRRYDRHCNLCDYMGPFSDAGVRAPRMDARCPACGALERHRLMKLMFESQPFIASGDRVLHFAPEPMIVDLARPAAAEYVTADLFMAGVDRILNIESLDLPEASFDKIICSNVLEHVDDRKALAEMHRVLAPGGAALLIVPIVEGWAQTYEDPAITDEADRELHFDQTDHVRIFGRDFRDRVRAAGFALNEFDSTPQECVRHALTRGGKIFIASKQTAS